jgi:hypothetical protein
MRQFCFNLIVVVSLATLISACNQNEDEDNLDLPEVISCTDINTNTTWVNRNNGVDYILQCNLSVNARLSIAPGVVIQCKNNAGITIESNGALVAVGNALEKIVLKGEVEQPGSWKGLFFRSNSPENELNHVTIAHGGSASFDGLNIKANLRVKPNARIRILNSTLERSAGQGVYFEGLDIESQNALSAFSVNTFRDNAAHPISCIAPNVSMFDGLVSTYTSNGTQAIEIRGGKAFGDHTWKKCSIPYRIEEVVLIGHYDDNGSLTVEPGCQLIFGGDAGLCTGEYSTGSWMRIVGTATERITLTGASPSAGFWKGIAFQSLSPLNEIAYADVSFGGSSSYTGNTAQKANIRAGSWSAGRFTIANCNISSSSAYGIYATMASPDVSIPPSVVFTNNALGNYFHE